MAQQCFMFLDWGDGWVAVNDHDNDVAALDGFSIQWGTDGIDQQPDPSVMTFRLRDATGWLTGRALTLAGARTRCGGLDHLIGGAVAEKSLQGVGVHLVAAAVGTVAADERRTGKGEIAYGVKRLVAHELVLRVAQALDIDHRVVIGDDDGILQRGTKRMA